MESMGEQSSAANPADSEDHQRGPRLRATRLRKGPELRMAPDSRARTLAAAISRLEQEHVALLLALCDLEEQAPKDQDAVVVAALQVLLRDELRHTQHALSLASLGTYGVCEVCQRPLSRRHLSLLPAITRCSSCAGRPVHQH